MAQTAVAALTPGWMTPIWEAEEQRNTTRNAKAAISRLADIPDVPDGCQYSTPADGGCTACALPDCMIGDSYNGKRLGRLTRQVVLIRQAARMGDTPAQAVRRLGMQVKPQTIAIAQRAILSDPTVAESPAKAELRAEVLRAWAEEQERKHLKGEVK